MNPLPGKSNRLARLVHQSGGMTMSDAVTAADADLELIRASVVQEIEVTVGRIQAIGAASQRGLDPTRLDELYTLANSVVGMAGVFGMGCLGQVSFSLCALIDRFRTSEAWDGRGLQVHMDSLRLLRPGTAQDPAQQHAVVAALQQVVERLK